MCGGNDGAAAVSRALVLTSITWNGAALYSVKYKRVAVGSVDFVLYVTRVLN